MLLATHPRRQRGNRRRQRGNRHFIGVLRTGGVTALRLRKPDTIYSNFNYLPNPGLFALIVPTPLEPDAATPRNWPLWAQSEIRV
jgi:hypothetical protein